MEVLLDTQALIYAADPQQLHKLPSKAKRAITSASRRYISVVSVYEIALKDAKGKLQMNRQIVEQVLEDLFIDLLPVSPEHVFRAFTLPMHHSDPFDRLIIITALEQGISLIGGDSEFKKYKGLKLIWD